MSKVLKFIHAETEGASLFGRDLLEAFPEEADMVHVVEATPEGELEGEPAPVDTEQLRQEVLAAARDEAAQKVQEAYQEGLSRGTEAGKEAFEATLAECAAALTSAGDQLEAAHRAFLENLEPQVIALVKDIAAKVIAVELQTNDAILARTVSRALSELVGEHAITLLLNPQDLEAMRDQEVKLLDSFPRITTLNLEADESIAPGSCIARTDTMDVDGRLDTLLAHVLDSLTE